MKTEDIKKNIDKNLDKLKEIGKKIGDVIEEIKDNLNHNLFDYIEEYGNYTFDELEFNEVDNVIFSMLTYVDFNFIVSENKQNKKNMSQVSKEFFEKHSKSSFKNSILPGVLGARILEKISSKNRYKDILLFNYLYRGNADSQFSAITFDLGHRLYYVGFEGTDLLISGWEEDCKMAYSFPVEAQRLAKEYLKKYTFKNVKLIVGGHSKGGNLALVSSMYTNFLVRWKIKRVYSNDGLGLRDEQINSKKYRKIEKKFTSIIPDSSIVGLLLRHSNNYIVIKANRPGIVSHDPITWQIDKTTFTRATLTRFSRVFEDGFSRWFDKYDDDQRRQFVKSFFDILREYEIETLLQFTTNYSLIVNVLKSSRKIDPLVKEMGRDLVRVLNQTNLEYPLFK